MGFATGQRLRHLSQSETLDQLIPIPLTDIKFTHSVNRRWSTTVRRSSANPEDVSQKVAGSNRGTAKVLDLGLEIYVKGELTNSLACSALTDCFV